MTQKRKDDTGRFMQAIAALSAEPEQITAKGRWLRPVGGDLLGAVLTELDETVLRRHLVFKNDQGQSVALDIGERRLFMVLALPQALHAEHGDLLDRPLSEKDSGRVHAAFSAFCALGVNVFVRSHLPETEETTEFGGLSATQLRHRITSQALSGVPEDIAQAIHATKPEVTALVVADADEILARYGEEAACDLLSARLAECSLQVQPQVTHWQSDTISATTLLLAQTQAVKIAALIPPENAFLSFTRIDRAFLRRTQ